MPVVDPASWEVLPFGDQNAFLDFLGVHALWHHQADVVIRLLGGNPYATLPLGDGGGAEWHDAHQVAHDGMAAALLLATPLDFRSYDLTDPDQFATWTFLHAREHQRIRQAGAF